MVRVDLTYCTEDSPKKTPRSGHE